MKKVILLSIVLLLLSVKVFCQTKTADKQNIQVVTDQEPSYPKGEQALADYILYNVKYSDEAKKKYIEGEVTLNFDVLTDSTVTNVMVISGVGHGIDEEVVRLIKTLKFSPARQSSFPVKMNVMMSFPVKAH